MAGGFDSMPHKEAVGLVLCSGPGMGDTLLKCKNDYSQSRAGVVLRCMKTTCHRGIGEYLDREWVSHLHGSLKAHGLMLSHITQAQDAARQVLIKSIKCYFDSQHVELTHKKMLEVLWFSW